MSNIFAIFNTATTGLYTSQLHISTTSHNIANEETPGYSRQRVNVRTNTPYSEFGIGKIGTGVNAVSVTRIRSEYLDNIIRTETSTKGKFDALQGNLTQVEYIMNEASSLGIGNTVNEMLDAWQTLSKNPESASARTNLAKITEKMAQDLNYTSKQLEELRSSLVPEVSKEVSQVNGILKELEQLNRQIGKSEAQGITPPNDLLDSRDYLVEQLASKVPIDVTEDMYGRIRITEKVSGNSNELLPYEHTAVATHEMSSIKDAVAVYDGGTPPTQTGWSVTVDKGGNGEEPYTFEMGMTDADGNPVNYEAGDVVFIRNDDWTAFKQDNAVIPNLETADFAASTGTIAGYAVSFDKMQEYSAEMDKIAYVMATAINTIHNVEPIIDPANPPDPMPTGLDFFATNDGSDRITAKNIAINPELLRDPKKINIAGAPADYTDPLNPKFPGSGDGLRAEAISNLRDFKLPMGSLEDIEAFFDPANGNYNADTMTFESGPDGSTIKSYYTNLVTTIGLDAKAAQDGAKSQDAVLAQLEGKRQSVSGVSLDEEVSNLIKFQTSYQANARVMNTVTTMLDTLINQLGQ